MLDRYTSSCFPTKRSMIRGANTRFSKLYFRDPVIFWLSRCRSAMTFRIRTKPNFKGVTLSGFLLQIPQHASFSEWQLRSQICQLLLQLPTVRLNVVLILILNLISGSLSFENRYGSLSDSTKTVVRAVTQVRQF